MEKNRRKIPKKYTTKELLEKAEYIKDKDLQKLRYINEKKLREQTVLRRARAYTEDSEILPVQRAVLSKFLNDYITRGDVKPTSMTSALYCIHKLAQHVSKPFLEMDRDDINDFVAKWYSQANDGEGYAERSRTHMNVHVKYFFKWLYDREKIEYKKLHPQLVEHLNTIVKERVSVKATDLVTPKQVKGMVNACTHPRDKAIVAVLYDSGCRARELIDLRIKDIVQEKPTDKYYTMQIRDGKTGSRTVYLRESAQTLRIYLNQHPYANDPDAPLFVNVSRAQWGRQLKYQGLASVVRVSAKNAGIDKPVRPHLLRHSRATHLACREGWNEYRLRQQFGWSSTSSTPSIYVHLGKSDFKQQFLMEYGLLGENEAAEELENKLAMMPITCPNCAEENPPDAIACHCGMPLSHDAVEKVKKMREQANSFIADIKELPIRPNLIKEGATQADYQEALVKNDPILRREFTKIAEQLIKATNAQREEEWPSPDGTQKLSQNPQADNNRELIIRLRKKGMSLQDIQEVVGIGYGTIQSICKSAGL